MAYLGSKLMARPRSCSVGYSAEASSPPRKSARLTKKTSNVKNAKWSNDGGGNAKLDAVITIQRWFRRDIWVFLWDRAETGFKQRIRAAGMVRIVEPSGQQYYFMARDLALMFVASATATHPVTRRQLLPTEMRRVGKHLPPRLRVLFVHTQKHSEDAARAARQEDSLTFFLHAAAGDSLDLAISASEFDYAGDADLRDLLDDYERTIADVASQFPKSVRGLLQQHRTLLDRRKSCCDKGMIDTIAMHLGFLRAEYADDMRGAELSRPAFVSWILEAVR